MTFIISEAKRQPLKWLLLMALMSSCATTQIIDEKKIYRKDLEIDVDGVVSRGVYVAPHQHVYQMTFSLPDKPNIVKLTTCHRELTFKDPGKALSYQYIPVSGLEDSGSCLFEVGAFDAEGYHVWGLVDFQNDEKMVGIVGCNGESFSSKGASICQSKAGLIQKIYFPLNGVEVVSPERCPKMQTKDNHLFTYELAGDKCIYLFSDGKLEHRHTTFGYDEVLIK